jgi:hypothetical protein
MVYPNGLSDEVLQKQKKVNNQKNQSLSPESSKPVCKLCHLVILFKRITGIIQRLPHRPKRNTTDQAIP